MKYIGPIIVLLVLVYLFTMVPYVRRRHVEPKQTTVTSVDGSRDRNLHGKARRRARQGR